MVVTGTKFAIRTPYGTAGLRSFYSCFYDYFCEHCFTGRVLILLSLSPVATACEMYTCSLVHATWFTVSDHKIACESFIYFEINVALFILCASIRVDRQDVRATYFNGIELVLTIRTTCFCERGTCWFMEQLYQDANNRFTLLTRDSSADRCSHLAFPTVIVPPRILQKKTFEVEQLRM